jgi:hypothetical protein
LKTLAVRARVRFAVTTQALVAIHSARRSAAGSTPAPAFTCTHSTYASPINQVEPWFAYLVDDLLRRSDHHSVHALEKDIRAWVQT